jgi:signal peptidase II
VSKFFSLHPTLELDPNPMRWLWLSGLVVLLDQLTKYLASSHLRLYEPVPIIPSFNLTLMHNTGAAFSLLSEAGGWQRWLFIGLAFLISGLLITWLYKLARQKVLLPCALSLVLGGALGNVWDRLSLGYVIDFIDVYYAQWHWPAFNIADSAISVGAVLLLLDAFREKSKT